MMVRRMNKRGDEGFKLVNLLIALVVLIVIVIAIFFVTQQGRSVGQNLPGKSEIIAQACSAVDSPTFRESYCNQIREIGRDKYVTCNYAYRIEKLAISPEDDDASRMTLECGPLDGTDVQRSSFARQIRDMGLRDPASINGNPVSGYYVDPVVSDADKADADKAAGEGADPGNGLDS